MRYASGLLKALQPILVSTSQGLQTVAFDQLRFPDIGLAVNPSLAVTIEDAGSFSGHLVYVAPGLSWSAHYEMVYDPKVREVRIYSSAVLSNATQLAIEKAGVTVVAGQLSTAASPNFQPEMDMPMLRSAAMDRGPCGSCRACWAAIPVATARARDAGRGPQPAGRARRPLGGASKAGV